MNIARRLKLLVILAGFCAACAACATTGTTAGPIADAPAQIAVDCGAPAVRDIASHLVDDVASALLTSGDWHTALNQLAATETARLKSDAWPAIKCAIAEVGARAGVQMASRAAMDADAAKLTETTRDRAAQWLAEHPAP